MAGLTRFISTSPTPNVPDQSRASPEVYAQVSEADLANNRAVDAMIAEGYGKYKQQQAAQDNLYTSQAKADMQLYMNNAAKQLKSQASPNGDLQSEAAKAFDAHALELIKNAPSPAAQQHLLSVFPGLRTSAQINLGKYQDSLDKQETFNQFSKTINSFANLATANPDYSDHVKSQVESYGRNMVAAGYDAKSVLAAMDKANQSIDMSVARQIMAKDPINGLDKLKQGAFSQLPPAAVRTLESVGQASLKAAQKAASEDIKGIEDRLFAGQPVPSNYESAIQRAVGMGLQSQADDLTRLLHLNSQVTGSNAAQLRDLANTIEVGAKTGAINADPARVQKFLSFVNGNLKAMEQDGITYAETKGAFNPVTPITDFTNIDPKLAQERKYRALQTEEQLGVPTSALKQVELDNLVSQISKMGVNDRVKVLGNLQQFGNRTMSQLADSLEKVDPGLASAAAISLRDPDLSRQVILGNEAMKAKLVELPKEEEIADAALKAFGSNDLFGSDPLVKGRYLNAARAIYAHDHSIGGRMDFQTAVERAAGIISMDREGILTGNYQTQAPTSGMSSYEFKQLLNRNLTSLETWKQYGNGVPSSLGGDRPVNVEKTTPDNFQYIPAGNGKYMVVRDGRKVANEKGQPFLIDLTKLAQDRPYVYSPTVSIDDLEKLDRALQQ